MKLAGCFNGTKTSYMSRQIWFLMLWLL